MACGTHCSGTLPPLLRCPHSHRQWPMLLPRDEEQPCHHPSVHHRAPESWAAACCNFTHTQRDREGPFPRALQPICRRKGQFQHLIQTLGNTSSLNFSLHILTISTHCYGLLSLQTAFFLNLASQISPHCSSLRSTALSRRQFYNLIIVFQPLCLNAHIIKDKPLPAGGQDKMRDALRCNTPGISEEHFNLKGASLNFELKSKSSCPSASE